MKSSFVYIAISIILYACSSSNKLDYSYIETLQDYTVPEIDEKNLRDKNVLLVFPHADDEVVCSGLVQYFKNNGASVYLLNLGFESTKEANNGRYEELMCSAKNLGIDSVYFGGFYNNNWQDIINLETKFWYDNKKSIKDRINEVIEDVQPYYAVTYDSEIGGYGHPEHFISAQLVLELFMDKPNSPIEKIYQITLSDGLEQFTVDGNNAYEVFTELNKSAGLPTPNYAVTLNSRSWQTKNMAATCHKSQESNMRKFYILSTEKNFESHSKAFSREYYYCITRD